MMQPRPPAPPPGPAPGPGNSSAALNANLSLCFGAGNDHQRSPDEVRIIKEQLAQEVEDFCQENRVDQRAARELMQEPVYVQLMVLDRGALKNCTNPSGAFVARIRDAKKQPPPTPAPQNPGPAQPAGAPLAIAGVPSPPASELERYIVENKLDHGAATLLRGESQEIQYKVMALGSVVNAPNPSASFIIRLRQVQQGGGVSGQPGVAPSVAPGLQPSTASGVPPPTPPPPPQAPAYGMPGLNDMIDQASRDKQAQYQYGAPNGGSNGSLDQGALDDAAMRAIQMLQGPSAGAPDPSEL